MGKEKIYQFLRVSRLKKYPSVVSFLVYNKGNAFIFGLFTKWTENHIFTIDMLLYNETN